MFSDEEPTYFTISHQLCISFDEQNIRNARSSITKKNSLKTDSRYETERKQKHVTGNQLVSGNHTPVIPPVALFGYCLLYTQDSNPEIFG